MFVDKKLKIPFGEQTSSTAGNSQIKKPFTATNTELQTMDHNHSFYMGNLTLSVNLLCNTTRKYLDLCSLERFNISSFSSIWLCCWINRYTQK